MIRPGKSTGIFVQISESKFYHCCSPSNQYICTPITQSFPNFKLFAIWHEQILFTSFCILRIVFERESFFLFSYVYLIFPSLADNSLVRLFTIEDDESTSYINAVYVDVSLLSLLLYTPPRSYNFMLFTHYSQLQMSVTEFSSTCVCSNINAFSGVEGIQ